MDRLTSSKTLWTTFLLTIIMTLMFGLIMLIWDFEIIDEMYDPSQIAAHIESMSPRQKIVHIWMTATLDVAYPFAYAAFFVGVTLRFFGKFGPFLSFPGVLVIPADLAEGLVQILVLNGHTAFIPWKAVVTPLKFALYFPALGIALIGLGIGLAIKRRARV